MTAEGMTKGIGRKRSVPAQHDGSDPPSKEPVESTTEVNAHNVDPVDPFLMAFNPDGNRSKQVADKAAVDIIGLFQPKPPDVRVPKSLSRRMQIDTGVSVPVMATMCGGPP